MLFRSLFSNGDLSAEADKSAGEASESAYSTGLLKFSPYCVLKVRLDGEPGNSDAPCHARRNDKISVQVQNLRRWFEEKEVKEVVPKGRDTDHLILYLGGEPLLGLYPRRVDEWYDKDTNIISNLSFELRRDHANKAAWKKLLQRPKFERPLEVSVGFDNGLRVHS